MSSYYSSKDDSWMNSTGSLEVDVDLSGEVVPDPPQIRENYRKYGQNEFDLRHGRVYTPPDTVQNVCSSACRGFKCDRSSLWMSLKEKLPVIEMFGSYRPRKHLAGDVISGLSVGVLVIPQSMGYALLASLPPICGLYTSLWPALIYLMFGTMPYMVMGTSALSSLVIGDRIQLETQEIREQLDAVMRLNNSDNDTLNTIKMLHVELESQQIAIATTITLISGIAALIMTLLRLDIISSYISSAFMSGFLTGTNIRVLTRQIQLMLGVHAGSYGGPLNYVFLLRDMIRDLPNANVAQVVLSIISIIIIILVKSCVNERFQSHLRVPIPIELILVIIGTIISYFGKLGAKYGVQIIDTIPQGVPKPSMPGAAHPQSLIIDGIMVAVLCYVMMILMAKEFTERQSIQYRPRQELLALGITNMVSCFFSGYAASASPPRCFLMESTGGRSQVAMIITVILVAFSLMLLAPLLEALPVCILASIITVSCFPLFVHYKAGIHYWRHNKYDFSVWLITTLLVIFWDINVGLVGGVALSVFLVAVRTQFPYTTLLSHTTDQDKSIIDVKMYLNSSQIENVKIFHFESPLTFVNCGIFVEKLYSSTVRPADIKAKMRRNGKERESFLIMRAESLPKVENNLVAKSSDENRMNGRVHEMRDIHDTATSPGSHVDDIYDTATSTGSHCDDICDDTACSSLGDDSNVMSESHHPLHDERDNDNHTFLLKDMKLIPKCELRFIILDCSCISFMDTQAVQTLIKIEMEYSDIGVHLMLASCTESVRHQLYSVPSCRTLTDDRLYPSVHDAVSQARLIMQPE